MSDYTPTEDEIRKVWGIAVPQDRRPERDAAFDRWLEAHDREVAARALREAADDAFAARNGVDMFGVMDPAVSKSGVAARAVKWIYDRADRIEAGDSGWLTREVKRAKDRLTEIPPQARPAVTGGFFAGLHEAGDSDA